MLREDVGAPGEQRPEERYLVSSGAARWSIVRVAADRFGSRDAIAFLT
jgi:hypothetical protein